MSRETSPDSLTPRDREILKDVVYTYIVHGEPVSSRTVAKHERHALSSATIRNVMADLEDVGLLHQPHTSAGRVPTAAGYHLYIRDLMRQQEVPSRERHYIESTLAEVGGSAEDRIEAASQLLSELSERVGIVLVPAMGATVLRRIDFVPLSGTRVLCVIVSSSGFVDNKIVELDEPVSREDLNRVANYLSENFGGLSLKKIRDRLLALMDDERARMDRLLRLVIALGGRTLEAADLPDLKVEGTTELLSQPELADVDRVRRLFETFQDKARLVSLLNQCLEGPGVRAWIGDDTDLTSELDFSLVATPYRAGHRVIGSLGIMGPSRMQYERVIPLVEFLAATLSEALVETFEE
ncbi:MAG: heat-inducible transcriptional repressor HrcA [Thermoanaerobaculia bacterium]|nr:heat-inducible transcriptional repressor HrcA [Thermoanaerobaculia bacterium]